MRLVLSFDEPNYNEIISMIDSKVLSDKYANQRNDSIKPILKSIVEIIKDIPQKEKGSFLFYILNFLLTSSKTSNLFESIENFFRLKENIQFKIVSAIAHREEFDVGVKLSFDVRLENVDYPAIVDKFFPDNPNECPLVAKIKSKLKRGISKSESRIKFVIKKNKRLILTGINNLIEKTGININNLDYEIK